MAGPPREELGGAKMSRLLAPDSPGSESQSDMEMDIYGASLLARGYSRRNSKKVMVVEVLTMREYAWPIAHRVSRAARLAPATCKAAVFI